MTLGSWAHLAIKKKIPAEDAMAILNFTSAPIYLIFAD
jgi:hypothetical protein